MLGDIEALRLEIAGETPDNPVEIAGTTLPTRKRPAPAHAESPPTKYLKMGEPPSFHGKDVKELQIYEIAWGNRFVAMGECTSEAWVPRIAFAATFLKSTAAAAWSRKVNSSSTFPFTEWEEYMAFLRGIVADPATRKSEAIMSLSTLRQKDGQTVRELLAEVERLERDVPPMTDEEREAWTLLNSLKPALRTEVMRENREITTRELVLTTAQRHEELSKQLSKSTSQSNRGATSSNRGASASQSKPPATDNESKKGTEGTKPRPTRAAFKGNCNNCGKLGHKAVHCKSAPNDSSGRPAVESADKGKERSKN
jgi:hypothetical protein